MTDKRKDPEFLRRLAKAAADAADKLDPPEAESQMTREDWRKLLPEEQQKLLWQCGSRT